jgi:hypothetical protein
MVKYLNFHHSSFLPYDTFNINGKATQCDKPLVALIIVFSLALSVNMLMINAFGLGVGTNFVPFQLFRVINNHPFLLF